ncbi:S-adenosyl-L-methionine-dependent methyltransferase [Dichotomocladium elegans]|nr:S-adenosyl-L-methionine-dependent methyltransferase [Dichotomocladium elegans]
MGAQISKATFSKERYRKRAGYTVRENAPSEGSTVNFDRSSKPTYNDKDSVFSDSTLSHGDSPSVHSTDLGTSSRSISVKLPRRPRRAICQKNDTSNGSSTDIDRTSLSSFKSDEISHAHSVPSTFAKDIAPAQPCASDVFVFNRNDEQEYNRQLRQHYILKQVLGGNLQIELDTPPKMVLDSACGAGAWAIEMARTYPESKIIAMDISLPLDATHTSGIQPTVPNISFTSGDILSHPLPFEDSTFDFVYQREVGMVVPMNYWAPLFNDFARLLKPSGVLHLVEYDLGFPSCGPLSRIVNKAIEDLLKAAGYERYFTGAFETMLIDTGFSDIRIQSFHIPIGEWPENNAVGLQQGFLMKDLLKGLLKLLKPKIGPYLQIFMDDYDQFCAAMLDEIEASRCSYEWKVITARKV